MYYNKLYLGIQARSIYTMSIDFTKNRVLATITYVVFLSSVVLSCYFTVYEPTLPMSTPLTMQVDSLVSSNKVVATLIVLLLVFVNSLLVTRICIKNVIFLERSYMPSLIYVIFSVGYFSSVLSVRPLLVALLIILACRKIFQTFGTKSLESGNYLEIGALFGISSILYEQALFLFPLLIIALILFRFFNIREWLAAIFGFVFPIFLAAYVSWFLGGSFIGFFVNLIDIATSATPNAIVISHINPAEWSFIIVSFLIEILAVVKFYYNKKGKRGKLLPQKSFIFFVCFLIISNLILFVVPSQSLYFLPFTAIPIAVIIPYFFNASKANLVSNILYISLIIIVWFIGFSHIAANF